VRGVTCGACNLRIGHFGDDPDRLQAAARYLQQGSPENELPVRAGSRSHRETGEAIEVHQRA
jgi:Recombination endonuclease VII